MKSFIMAVSTVFMVVSLFFSAAVFSLVATVPATSILEIEGLLCVICFALFLNVFTTAMGK